MPTPIGSDIRHAVREELESQVKQQFVGMQNVVKNLAVQIQDLRFEVQEQEHEVAKLAAAESQEFHRLAVEMNKLQSQVEEQAAAKSQERQQMVGQLLVTPASSWPQSATKLPPSDLQLLQEEVRLLRERLDKMNGNVTMAEEDGKFLRKVDLDKLIQDKIQDRIKDIKDVQARHKETYEAFRSHVSQQIQEVNARFDKMESMLTNASTDADEAEPDPDKIDPDASHAALEAYCKSVEGVYEFDESIWDLALLISSPCLSSASSVQVVLLFATNIWMQTVFLLVCYYYFLGPSIDDDTVAATVLFRNFHAHDDRYLAYGTSLAQRLCSPNFQPAAPIGLDVGSYQNSVASDIESYLKEGGGYGSIEAFFNGEMMCILALFCWITSVMAELSTIMNFARAMIGIRSNHRSVFHYKNEEILLLCTSPARKVLTLMGIGIRFCITVSLTICGCFWLGGTDGITDLLLNAVALGFILAIPEALYAALIPDTTKTVFGNVAPLKRPHWPHLGRGCDIKTLFNLVFLPTLIVASYIFCCLPMVKDMRAVWHEMCKGPLDFTYSHDAMSRVQLSNIMRSTGALYDRNLTVQAVSDKIDGKTHGPQSWTLYEDPALTVQTVHKVSNLPFSELAAFVNPSCIDMFKAGVNNRQLFHLRAVILQQVGRDISLCGDFVGFCTQTNFQGTLIRTLCPQTCGCDTPIGVFGSIDPADGCPSFCRHSDKYQHVVRAMKCNGRTHMINQPYWASWAAYMDGLAYAGSIEGVGDAMRTNGCNFYRFVRWGNKSHEAMQHYSCRGELPGTLRPMAPLCPDLCKCFDEAEVMNPTGMCYGGPTHCVTHRG